MIRRTLILLALLVAFGAGLSAQSVSEVIEKALEAQGGRDTLMAVESSKAAGTIILQGGAISGELMVFQMNPNMLRQDMSLMGSKMIQGYDGEDAWKIVPAAFGGKGTPEAMTDEERVEIQFQSDLQDILINYEEKGHQIEYVGTEDMEGTEVHHLKITHSSGKVIDQLYDSDTGLLLKSMSKQYIAQAGQEMETHTYFSDFKEVEGLLLPHAIEIKMGGQTAVQIVMEKIELNPEIDKAVFSRPSEDSE